MIAHIILLKSRLISLQLTVSVSEKFLVFFNNVIIIMIYKMLKNSIGELYE